MIQGNLPFLPNYRNGVEEEDSLLNAIRKGSLDFNGSKWRKTSLELQSMVRYVCGSVLMPFTLSVSELTTSLHFYNNRNFLIKDVKHRMTVEEALLHPWILDSISILERLYRKMLSR